MVEIKRELECIHEIKVDAKQEGQRAVSSILSIVDHKCFSISSMDYQGIKMIFHL